MAQDRLKTFDVILANPPYSIKAWDQKAWSTDAWGRNLWGTPPHGCADYAFQQHIQASTDAAAGRSVVLWPHGVLFRDAETAMRKRMIESDAVEAVIGLGPNLFYNSPMESCLLVCRSKKRKERRGKILFINAVQLVRTEKGMSYLEEAQIQKIYGAYKAFADEEGFCKVVPKETVLERGGNLSVPLYVQKKAGGSNENDLTKLIAEWNNSSSQLKSSIQNLITSLR